MPVPLSETRTSEWVTSLSAVFPHHANPIGTLFGGHVLELMDVNASIACNRYARRIAVTASTEPIDFHNPVRVGDILEVRSRVAWVGRTSMVVRSEVHSEHPTTGERKLTTVGHLTFVAVDDDGRPVEVPRLRVEGPVEERHHALAAEVRTAMLERRKRDGDGESASGAVVG